MKVKPSDAHFSQTGVPACNKWAFESRHSYIPELLNFGTVRFRVFKKSGLIPVRLLPVSQYIERRVGNVGGLLNSLVDAEPECRLDEVFLTISLKCQFI